MPMVGIFILNSLAISSTLFTCLHLGKSPYCSWRKALRCHHYTSWIFICMFHLQLNYACYRSCYCYYYYYYTWYIFEFHSGWLAVNLTCLLHLINNGLHIFSNALQIILNISRNCLKHCIYLDVLNYGLVILRCFQSVDLRECDVFIYQEKFSHDKFLTTISFHVEEVDLQCKTFSSPHFL